MDNSDHPRERPIEEDEYMRHRYRHYMDDEMDPMDHMDWHHGMPDVDEEIRRMERRHMPDFMDKRHIHDRLHDKLWEGMDPEDMIDRRERMRMRYKDRKRD